ncbi:MAG: heme-binding protein [Proteobacteria bacterium]|nr:heme-binding protein [Pseudomonadota bacterium]
MFTKPALSLADAHRMLAACKAEAEKNGWKVTVAVVDDGGFPLLIERADGAPVQSPAIALGKARTSALSRTPTKLLEEAVKDRPALLSFPDRMPVQGGLPLLSEGVCVGAIGVSGVKSHEDEQVALAGKTAMGL